MPAKPKSWAVRLWYVQPKTFSASGDSAMPLITFSHPEHGIKTVYTAAGSHTETILKIAKDNQIPIAFDCQDGECGTCPGEGVEYR